LAATGAALIQLYQRDIAPRVQPLVVEGEYFTEIGGVKVTGIVDLIDAEGRVIDTKTAAKSPSGIQPDHRLQLISYDLLAPESRGLVRIDTLVKSKTVKIVSQSGEIGPGDVLYAERMYSMAQDAIRDGIFYPRRASNLCSRKYCAYWRRCEGEFGGEVKA
jgi:hypothetical protein